MERHSLRCGRGRKTALGFLAAVGLVAIVAALVPARTPSGDVAAIRGSRDPAAVVEVTHREWNGDAYVIPVEPVTGESWDVAATWSRYGYPDHVEYGSVDVDWNGASWVTSNENTTTNILDYLACTVATCGSMYNTHSYTYKLVADLADPVQVGGLNYYLTTVDFSGSSFDDGDELVGLPSCYHGATVSVPSPYTFGTTDTGPFDPAFNCNATGPSLTIPYD